MSSKITYVSNRVIDSDGISDGALVYVYQTGTSTPVNLYTDPSFITPTTNPYVVAAGALVPPLYTNYSGQIRVRVMSVEGEEVSDDDPYSAVVSSADLLSGEDGLGSDLVGFQRDDGEYRTVRDRLLDTVSLLDFIPDEEVAAIQAGTSTYDISSAWDDAMVALRGISSSDYFSSAGKRLFIPAGVYHVGSELNISDQKLSGVVIDGYGAILKPVTGLDYVIGGGGATTANKSYRIKIFGLMFDVRGVASIPASIKFFGGMSSAIIRDCYEYANGTTDSGHAFIRLAQNDVTDPNTAQFWVSIENCETRGMAEAIVRPTPTGYGVDLWGSENMTRIRNCNFNSNATGIRLYNGGGGGPGVSNAVLIEGCAFEGVGKAIEVASTDVTHIVGGLRIINNRFETTTTVLDLSGMTAVNNTNRPFLIGNYSIGGSVTNYVVDPNSTGYNSLDYSINPNNMQPQLYGSLPLSLKGFSATHALKIDANGKGIEFWNGATPCGNFNTRSGGGLTIDGGSSAQAIDIKHVKSLSSSNTFGKNFTGSVTFAGGGGSATAAVTFGTAEPDANFTVYIEPPTNNKFWVTSKATTGFTINCDSVLVSQTVRWVVIRHG